MHPHYIADEFGTCPICGMDLVKLETGADPMNNASAESRTVVTVAPEVMQNMGVRLAKAEDSQFGRAIRSFGIVTENERQQLEITSRVEGWIEDLKITAVGDQVKEGDLLFRLYSPQLVISQNDYIKPGTSDLAGRGLAQLRALGVQDKTIEQMKGLKQPMEFVPFYADRDGTVSELNLRQGAYVQRGMMMAKIQSYATVWLIVGVAEKDLGFISAETSAKVSFPSLPGREVTAKVDYVYPTVDTKTRTGQVRLVIDNPDGLIRPGSYADVSFEVGVEQRVAVPSESILKSGEGRYVVVSLGQGRFEPRAIEAGLVSGPWTEVKSGVKAGEDIVVSGQFLLDSESALRESFRKLERLQLPLSLVKLDDNQFAMIDHMVDAALYLHEALIDGYDPDPKFLDPAISIRDLMWPRFKDTKLAFVLEDAASALREAQKARAISETETALAKLVTALRPWLMDGAPDHYREKKVALFKEQDGKRLWLQKEGKPLNPYGSGAGEQIPWPETENPSTADVRGGAQSERLASKARKN
jgi:Cu(I)/Ag(I) efflux system membrane fusion protein